MAAMRSTNPESIDLNLLRVFLAVWESRSLTLAGEHLGLSQPAVSHALRRLRDIFDDPLFVRVGTSMTPTDEASRLHAPLDEALRIIGQALQTRASFEPRTVARTFRLAMSDMSEFYFLPPLLEALGRDAPRIRFDVVQMSVDTLRSAMRSGDVDLALGYLPGLGPECEGTALFDDDYVCMVRAAHPLIKRHLSVEDMRALRYVFAVSNTTGHGVAEDAFAALGIERDIVLRLPHFTIAPEIVRNTDLALVLPRSIAQRFNRGRVFRLLSLPVKMPAIEVGIHIHTRFAGNPGVAWLHALLVQMFAQKPAMVEVPPGPHSIR
jgi:DNA-binding transcriptional LysR family regulator